MNPDIPNLDARMLFNEVTDGIGNHQMIAASRLLARHEQGFWLRRFLRPDDHTTHAKYHHVTEIPDTNRRSSSHHGPIQHLRWDKIGDLLREGASASSSQEAILAVAASLVGEYSVNLRKVVAALNDNHMHLVVEAITESAG